MFAEGEVPYLWTDSLGVPFEGTGRYAGANLSFADGKISILINEKESGQIPFTADPYAYDEQLIETDGFYLMDCYISQFEYFPGYGYCDVLRCTVKTGDGEEKTLYFTTGSEEQVLYSEECGFFERMKGEGSED